MRRLVFCGLLALGIVSGGASALADEPHGGMLRFPDVSKTHIVFLYANDLWKVPKTGGTATLVASPPGMEMLPRFDRTGTKIAFAGNYDGDQDLYVVAADGGVPRRVTHHPTNELFSDWTADGRLIFSAFGAGVYPRAVELYSVSAEGGLPARLPVPYGVNGTISDDGEWLAYMPNTRDTRTWKRYRGGLASDIWLFNLKNLTSKKITDWEGTDTFPMWHGKKVYYLSDNGPAHRLNIWVYDTASGSRSQVTKHTDYDVKWPGIGPGSNGEGEIVYQLGAELRLLNLGTSASAAVKVTIPGARPKIREQLKSTNDLVYNARISSTGKRAVVEARGDVWTLPAKEGNPVNLTRTSGVAERDPAWSPDGRWIAYFSDATGAYELYTVQSDGAGDRKKRTDMGKGFLYTPTWSPDSKRIAFYDEGRHLYILDLDDGTTTLVDQYGDNGSPRVSWSHDSNWIAYMNLPDEFSPPSIWLYDVKRDRKHHVTSGMFFDSWPTFDREGKYLYFASQRDFSRPLYEDYGTTWIYRNTDQLFMVPLRDDIESPFAPESDSEEWGDKKDEEDDEDEEKEDDKDKKDEKVADLEIDIEGFERRAVRIPVESGGFTRLVVNDDDRLIYVRNGANPGDDPSIHILDLEDDEEEYEKSVLDGQGNFQISADGKKLLVWQNGRSARLAIMKAAEDQKTEDFISTSGMTAMIDPRAEWKQIFTDAWRVQRDYFYDGNMHGVDWPAVRTRYEAMLADCASRLDVSYVIGEMIAELNVGHAYYWGGDTEDAPSISVGMLGCDFERGDGAYRIVNILEGGAWDVDDRGPLSQPGVDVANGDYLLAVNGVPLDMKKDPWAAFQGMAGNTVTITVNDEPKMTDDARKVVIELLPSDFGLRYRAWVEKNRKYVEEKTGGRVGYIYVPNTGRNGQNELVRAFVGQKSKPALIIDERWNGGGQIPTRFVELLDRPIASYWATRFRDNDPAWPPDGHHGVKCMLINGNAGSGGDYFPFWFRERGLGKLIGMRTWGGLVGISGNPALIDGGYTSVPTFAFYEKDGTWGIEGHGVEPDIEVLDDPAKMVGGKDPQLDAAIAHILNELETNPVVHPKRPAYPDRSGMGITEQDK